MKIILVATLSFLLFSCATHQESELLGTWKSDEEKTLATVDLVEDIPDKTKAYLKDEFFGHLVVEYKENEVRAFFDNCEEKYENSSCKKNKDFDCDQLKEFSPYRLIEETPEHFIIGYYDDIQKEDVEKTLYREENCYYVYIGEKWDIKEYFCKQ